MSDTRAAIRELRSLSEKRSLSALTEAEAARWLTLRRQLGLPLEPAEALAVAKEDAALRALPPNPDGPELQPEAGPSLLEPLQQQQEDGAAPARTNGASLDSNWTGPALDSPAAPSASAWGGPSLDAPAWSDTVAERPTDPGLEEPPPIPFDEVPAAPHPHESTEVADFGGSPEERVPLATASEFVSYTREGNDSIELPAETGTAADVEPQSLAQLAGVSVSPPASSPWEAHPVPEEDAAPLAAHPEALADEGVLLAAELQRETAAPAEAYGVFEGVLPEPPLEAASPEVLGVDALLPPPVGVTVAETLGVFEGVVPELPAEPEVAPETQEAAAFLSALELGSPSADAEGVLEEAPRQLGGASPVDEAVLATEGLSFGSVSPADEAVLPEPPLQLGDISPLDEASLRAPPLQLVSALDEVLPAPQSDFPAEVPAPASTWAPGASEPPLLAADDFARGGDPLGGRGLDPWPEALGSEASAEDFVETVGDEDVVEDLSTPTPLPPFPAVTAPGSGGIRGFQFPRPPPGGPVAVPVPPTPPAWTRTQPPPSSPSNGAVPIAALRLTAISPSAAAPRTPAPASLRRPTSVSLPVPPPPPPRPPPPAAVPVRTPLPATAVSKPIAASAVAPVTPRPLPPPAGPGSAVPRPTPVPGRSETVLAPPAAVSAKVPVLSAAQEEVVQPLLDLVDEVEPPRAAAPRRQQPTPSPARGTPAVFGPPMVLNPSFVEGDHRVVIHTLEGQVHRGTVHNLDLQEDALAVQQPDGRSVELPTRRLKAVFFVLSPGEKPLPSRGERVQVTFRDGRQVVGYSDDHASGEPGFFVVPSDARTNTARVYVFRGGVQSITTG